MTPTTDHHLDSVLDFALPICRVLGPGDFIIKFPQVSLAQLPVPQPAQR